MIVGRSLVSKRVYVHGNTVVSGDYDVVRVSDPFRALNLYDPTDSRPICSGPYNGFAARHCLGTPLSLRVVGQCRYATVDDKYSGYVKVVGDPNPPHRLLMSLVDPNYAIIDFASVKPVVSIVSSDSVIGVVSAGNSQMTIVAPVILPINVENYKAVIGKRVHIHGDLNKTDVEGTVTDFGVFYVYYSERLAAWHYGFVVNVVTKPGDSGSITYLVQ